MQIDLQKLIGILRAKEDFCISHKPLVASSLLPLYGAFFVRLPLVLLLLLLLMEYCHFRFTLSPMNILCVDFEPNSTSNGANKGGGAGVVEIHMFIQKNFIHFLEHSCLNVSFFGALTPKCCT